MSRSRKGKRKPGQGSAAIAWDELCSQLPDEMRERFEHVLRRSLERRLRLIGQLDTSVAPLVVRNQAVGEWRRRYMKDQSKADKKRMGYDRLHREPTYLDIERKMQERYWQARYAGPRPLPSDVDGMTFVEVCSAYRATEPKLEGTSLGEWMRSVAQKLYAETRPADAVREHMARTVCEAARSRRFGPDGDGAYLHHDLSLANVSSKEETVALVRRSHLVEAILQKQYRGKEPYLVARDAIAATLADEHCVVAMNALACGLTGTEHPTDAMLKRLARQDARHIEAYLRSIEFAERAAEALLANPIYGVQYRQAIELRLRVRENVPQTPMEAYPLARTMRRHITLHVGPTNSGKTHDALQALAEAESGVYLGPLRLLAYEQFMRLNHMGCVCSLLTGEESMELAGARHVSSTVEMASFYEPVDVAVIDEAQMIADKSRGHHWTEALLGIPAREVHVCLAPHAERVVRELVTLCKDELEVVRHERLVPLRPDKGGFRMPEDVQPGDALVVFSRKSVHAVAAQVAACGMRASVVYGALPHDVRHEEARRFLDGETDVVVATDAIGMGMNLPIRRVVFVEQEKFDGVSKRPLRPEEIQQIAGRAGRFGRYDAGYYQSTRLRREITRKYGKEVPAIESIPVGIPENIALVRDATLSDCIRQWMALEQPAPFHRIDVTRDMALIAEVERRLVPERRTCTDDKVLVMALATMAFDERDKDLHRTWQKMVDAELSGRAFDFDVPPAPAPDAKLIELEQQYRYCDLLYTYARTFGHPERIESLVRCRTCISHAIIAILGEDHSDVQKG